MARDIEFVFGVICKAAEVDPQNGLVSLNHVLPVIAVDARCNGKPKEDVLAIKLDSLMLVLVFRRKRGEEGKLVRSVNVALHSDDKLLAEGLALDVVMKPDDDSMNHIIDLEGAIVPCPSAEGTHLVGFTIKLDDAGEHIGQVETLLKISVTHSIEGLPK